MKKQFKTKTIALALLLALGVAFASYYVVNKTAQEKVMKADPGND